MQTRFEFQCSYQDLMAYKVIGHADISSIETYYRDERGLEYIRSTFNHCCDPTSFERNVLSRQGGAVVHTRNSMLSRSTPEFYAEFVASLYAKYEAGRVAWAATCKRRGWGESELKAYEEMRPVPKAMYFDHDVAKAYVVEPWWTPNMAMTGILNCPIHAEICTGALGAIAPGVLAATA
jgi:hypothetical protein